MGMNLECQHNHPLCGKRRKYTRRDGEWVREKEENNLETERREAAVKITVVYYCNDTCTADTSKQQDTHRSAQAAQHLVL